MASSSSPSRFFEIYLLHSVVVVTCKALMMFYLNKIAVFEYGKEMAWWLQGLMPHDWLLIHTLDSLVRLLLFIIGFLLFMVSFMKDKDFQAFFARGCMLLHAAMALWCVYLKYYLKDLTYDWPCQLVNDLILAFFWILLLAYSWQTKYD